MKFSTSSVQPTEVEVITPHSTGSKGPGFKVPEGACDCHMQLLNTASPFVHQRVLKHSDATVEAYRRLQRRLHLHRSVLVQPSDYGCDHRMLLAGLKALGPGARGVAVIDPTVTHAELEKLRAGGVVGAHFNIAEPGATSEGMLEDVAKRIRPLGWHLQVHAHPQDLLRMANRLLALPVPIVIDHFARLNVAPKQSSAITALLLKLLGSGKAWLKLSAPYIASPKSQAYEDLDNFVRQLAYKRSDRLIWGTNWPHMTEPSSGKPDDAVLMNLLARWLSVDEMHCVLVDNPALLYQFGSDL